MGQETELKLTVPRSELTKVGHSQLIRSKQAAARRDVDVISVYYDTRRRDLNKHGVSFRLRRQGNEYLQTVKANFDAYPGKKEWECSISDNKPDFGAVKGTALEPLLDKKSARQLKPVFETRVRRTIVPLKWGASEVEVAVDRGQVKAARLRAPISELELELKKGDASDYSRLRTPWLRSCRCDSAC
jgi:inorganic triphosphatase YgiF